MAKIMLVEDSKLIRSILKKIIVGEGHDVIEVESGKDAVIVYESETPDLVFMDINLPGINGLDATQEILSMNPEAKVIMCTIMDKPEYQERAKGMGAVGYIVKPFSKQQIVETVNANI